MIHRGTVFLELDGSKIISFIEKPEDLEYGNNISLGVYCLFKEDIHKVKNELQIPCSFEKAVFPELASNQLLNCYKVEGENDRCRDKRGLMYLCSYR